MVKVVADYMTREPICLKADSPLKQAVQLMAQHRISGLPVIDDQDKAVGVISETDLMWQATGVTPPPHILLLDSVIYLQNPATYERDLHKALGQTVGEVMTGKPLTIKQSLSLAEAARQMNEHKIHRLLVVDDEQILIGVLTRGDIVRAMAEELQDS